MCSVTGHVKHKQTQTQTQTRKWCCLIFSIFMAIARLVRFELSHLNYISNYKGKERVNEFFFIIV